MGGGDYWIYLRITHNFNYEIMDGVYILGIVFMIFRSNIETIIISLLVHTG